MDIAIILISKSKKKIQGIQIKLKINVLFLWGRCIWSYVDALIHFIAIVLR